MSRRGSRRQLPAPTGAHRVGRLALDLTDERRPDPYARRAARRRLGVWVWYPGTPSAGARPGDYLPGWWRALGPVWGFRPGVRLLNPKSLAGAFSIPGKRPYAEDLHERARLIDVKTADIRFVLDELGEVNERHEILAGRLDLTRVGALRHSFGGGASAEACRLDGRFRAGASIDGGLWKAPADVEASGPFLQLFGEHPEYVMSCAEAVSSKYFATREYCEADRETTVGAWQALHERRRPGSSVLVKGAGHASFIDWPLLPLWRYSLARRGLGTPPPGVVWRVASDYLLVFFDEHLRGRPRRLRAADSSDCRVRIDAPAALFA
jgi:hypothetical protein